MKKAFLTFGCMVSLFAITSCREEAETKEVVREVEVREVKVEKEDKGILERAGEKVDQKVSKEVNEEIDKIGDDN